jgi:lysophospholipase L1-like esterase
VGVEVEIVKVERPDEIKTFGVHACRAGRRDQWPSGSQRGDPFARSSAGVVKACQSLAGLMNEQVGCTMHWHPETTTTAGMAADGIHPSSEGYATWADGLSRRILAAQVPRVSMAS